MDPYEQGRMGLPLNTGAREANIGDQMRHAEGQAESRWQGSQARRELGRNIGKLLVKHPGEYVRRLFIIPIGLGVIAGVVALIAGRPPLQVAAIVGGGSFAIMLAFTLVVLAGLGVMILIGNVFAAVGLILSSWRWFVPIGALCAGLGFVSAKVSNDSDTLVRQTVIDLGLAGLIVGATGGTAFRLIRRASTKRRSRESSGSRTTPP